MHGRNFSDHLFFFICVGVCHCVYCIFRRIPRCLKFRQKQVREYVHEHHQSSLPPLSAVLARFSLFCVPSSSSETASHVNIQWGNERQKPQIWGKPNHSSLRTCEHIFWTRSLAGRHCSSPASLTQIVQNYARRKY